MKNNDVMSPGDLIKTGNKLLDYINNKPILRANIRHWCAATALMGLIGWQTGFHVWVVLIYIFLVSVPFFGKNVTSGLFRFELAGVIIILLAGFGYKECIQKPGMSDSFFSYLKDQVLKTSVSWKNPAVDIEGRMAKLVDDRAKEYLSRDTNDFAALAKDWDTLQVYRNELWNKVYNQTGKPPAIPQQLASKFKVRQGVPVNSQAVDYDTKYQLAIKEGYKLVWSGVLDSGQTYTHNFAPSDIVRTIFDKSIIFKNDNQNSREMDIGNNYQGGSSDSIIVTAKVNQTKVAVFKM